MVVNGFLREDLSVKTGLEEVVAIDLFSAVADARYNKIVRKYLARNAGYHNNGLTALNTAFLQSGVFLWIPKNVKLERPLQVTFLTDADDGASFPRVVGGRRGEQLRNSDSRAFHPATTANTSRTRSSRLCSKTERVSIIIGCSVKVRMLFTPRPPQSNLVASSRYATTSINLGARLSRHDVSVVMDHEGAETSVDGLYVVGADQHTDTHSVIDHKQPYCSSHQLYKGILDDNGRAVFNGKIFVREGAQKTDAMQTNKNLLLSNKARVDTKPQLEIYADDVKCAHGAAVGQIDPEELFYLETRGINPELGRKLLTYGFAEEVIAKIGIESIRSQLDEIVLRQLHTNLEA